MARPRVVNVGACLFPGCDRAARAKRLCPKHYRTAASDGEIERAKATWSAESLHWIAGLLEGEAYFRSKVGPDGYASAYVRVSSTDEDVLVRLKALIGMGQIYGPRTPKGSQRKPWWCYQLGKRKVLEALCLAIRPLMGQRRQAQIDALLNAPRGRRHYVSFPDTLSLKRVEDGNET